MATRNGDEAQTTVMIVILVIAGILLIALHPWVN